MPCPTLDQLPASPPDKTGWPWTEESGPVPQDGPGGRSWPRVTIVTPSYNQAGFLEAAIRSVLLQGYPALEYVVIDGASTDGSAEIIRKYEPWLAHSVSEPDRGQYDAINKGFAVTDAPVMAWLNADDMYTPNSLRAVGEIFATLGQDVAWLTGRPAFWDAQGHLCAAPKPLRASRALIRWGCCDGRGLGFIQQESTFWLRSLWERSGGYVNADLHLAGDFDLWRRYSQHADLYSADVVLAGFRRHGGQKTSGRLPQYYKEVDQCLSDAPDGRWIRRLLRNRLLRQPVRLYLAAQAGRKSLRYDAGRKRWSLGG